MFLTALASASPLCSAAGPHGLTEAARPHAARKGGAVVVTLLSSASCLLPSPCLFLLLFFRRFTSSCPFSSLLNADASLDSLPLAADWRCKPQTLWPHRGPPSSTLQQQLCCCLAYQLHTSCSKGEFLSASCPARQPICLYLPPPAGRTAPPPVCPQHPQPPTLPPVLYGLCGSSHHVEAKLPRAVQARGVLHRGAGPTVGRWQASGLCMRR